MWQSICKFFYAFSHYLLVNHSLLIKKILIGPLQYSRHWKYDRETDDFHSWDSLLYRGGRDIDGKSHIW